MKNNKSPADAETVQHTSHISGTSGCSRHLQIASFN